MTHFVAKTLLASLVEEAEKRTALGMRILLTNDDGIDGRGLLIAERAARAITDDVWVVAPLHEQSGVHRAISLLTPVRIKPAGERRFAVHGTPTDCVVLAVLGG